MMRTTIDLTKYFDFSHPNIIRIKEHRIGIEHILDYYHEGYNPDEIAQELPGVELETIYATITYYLANQTEVSDYLQRRLERSEQAYQEWATHPSPLIQRLREVRDKRAEPA